MKIILVFMVFLLLNGAAQAQPHSGVFNQLIQIKYSTEIYLSNALKKSDTKKADTDTALAVYNTLRYKIDGLVYSISADMIAHNSPRKIRLLNDWCLKTNLKELTQKELDNAKPTIKVYAYQLIAIKDIYDAYILRDNENSKTINLSTNVFYLLKDSYTIINGLSDLKTKQTMALVELLDHTRLLSPSEVGKLVK